MDYLIDRKFWNLVIKKVKPNTALKLKEGLKKPAGKYRKARIKKDNVLSLQNKNLFTNGFFVHKCLDPEGDYLGASTQQNYEIEKAMLEVLIETQLLLFV